MSDTAASVDTVRLAFVAMSANSTIAKAEEEAAAAAAVAAAADVAAAAVTAAAAAATAAATLAEATRIKQAEEAAAALVAEVAAEAAAKADQEALVASVHAAEMKAREEEAAKAAAVQAAAAKLREEQAALAAAVLEAEAAAHAAAVKQREEEEAAAAAAAYAALVRCCGENCSELAVVYCDRCSSEFCAAHQHGPLRGHTLITLVEREKALLAAASDICTEHGEQRRLWCSKVTCRVRVCADCHLYGAHKGHSTTLLSMAATERRLEIAEWNANVAIKAEAHRVEADRSDGQHALCICSYSIESASRRCMMGRSYLVAAL
jgi:hypothetical protein